MKFDFVSCLWLFFVGQVKTVPQIRERRLHELLLFKTFLTHLFLTTIHATIKAKSIVIEYYQFSGNNMDDRHIYGNLIFFLVHACSANEILDVYSTPTNYS